MKYVIAILTALVLLFAALWGAFSKKPVSPPTSNREDTWEGSDDFPENILEGSDDFPEDIMPEKPVIYLYPTEPTTVDVKLETIGSRLTVTDPEYGNGWRVLAQPDGTLRNLADGKEYPYLFWEAEHYSGWPPFSGGFLVKRDDLESFLREKLAYLGLLPVEYEEFLDYWLPVLRPNQYTFLHFAGEEYTSCYPLTVTPAPDSMLRVHLVFMAATGRERVAPQTLAPFERKGFAVVEWGGTVLR